jgi:hypothetical protein
MAGLTARQLPMQIRFKEIFPLECKTFLPGMIGDIEEKEALRLIKAGIASPFKVSKPNEKAMRKDFQETRIGNK